MLNIASSFMLNNISILNKMTILFKVKFLKVLGGF